MESAAPDGPTTPGRPCPPVGTLKSCQCGPGSARRMVVEPGLQVAMHAEIEQVFRQLFQLLQG
jgi:hypothetical protein